MRNYIIAIVGLFAVTIISTNAIAQKRSAQPVANRSMRNAQELIPTRQCHPVSISKNKPVKLAKRNKHGLRQNKLSACDTLNYPLEGNYAFFEADDGGFVGGNNAYGDMAKANYFSLPGVWEIKEVLFDFGEAIGNSDLNITFCIWDNSGEKGAPGTLLATTEVPMEWLKNDVADAYMTLVDFGESVLVADAFYVGLLLPKNEGDSIGLHSNEDGDTFPGIAWEMWDDGMWSNCNDSWKLDIAFAIHPIVCESVTDMYVRFSADPMQGTAPVEVRFQDNSTGDITSWQWSFPGGEPSSSTLQNPVVIYKNDGVYDVSLKISDGENELHKSETSFIQVLDASQACDTLNYPLPGTYTYYSADDGGYVSGNNVFGDKAKAQYFNFSGGGKILSALIDFVYVSGSNTPVELAIWDDNGIDGSPGTKIWNQSVSIDQFVDDYILDLTSFVEFNTPALINGPFYMGVVLPSTPGDTVVLYTNSDGVMSVGNGWEMWESGEWSTYSSGESWDLNLANAIFPILCKTENSGANAFSESLIDIWPNPTSGIVNINLPSVEGEVRISIVNILGKEIQTHVVNGREKKITLDCGVYPAGLYFVVTEIGKDMVVEKLFILKN